MKRRGTSPTDLLSVAVAAAAAASIATITILSVFHFTTTQTAHPLPQADFDRVPFRRSSLPVDISPQHVQSSVNIVDEVLLDVEIWAKAAPAKANSHEKLAELLSNETVTALAELCGRCLYRTLTQYVQVHGQDGRVFVMTGDIPAMWTRDSAVQMGAYLPRIAKLPWMRRVVEGSIKALAFFILQDPWANAYHPRFKQVDKQSWQDRVLGRGGWVWTRNFELDSSGYFFNFLYNYYKTPAVWSPEQLLGESLIHDAVVTMLKVLELEQRHAELSPYRYSELPFEGNGKPTAYTGLLWTGFRPSDDMVQFPYNIPGNMYVAGSLQRIGLINRHVWKDPYIAETTARLAADIKTGIENHGMVEVDAEGGGKVKIYAYEVDGLGGSLADFDDPNLPSLLAMPLLGYAHYDPGVYQATRQRILSSHNRYYFKGTQLTGVGSPHTGSGNIWPLAHSTMALTTTSMAEQVGLVKDLLRMQAGNGLMHESVSVNNPAQFTRQEFGWAQALTVVTVEQLLGVDCHEEAEKMRLKGIEDFIALRKNELVHGNQDKPYFYNLLSAQVNYDA